MTTRQKRRARGMRRHAANMARRAAWRVANPMWCRHCTHGMHGERCRNCGCEDWDW